MARCPWALEVSSHSSSRLSARAAEASAAAASTSPRSSASWLRWSAISAGTLTSMLAARPAVGSNGSLAVPGGRARPRRATAPPPPRDRWCLPSAPVPATAASGTGPVHRGAPTASGGPSPPSPRRKKTSSKCCSISRAAQVMSPGGHRVPDRVVGQPVLLAPGGGVAVQLPRPVGLLLLQAGLEQVGEQVVVAPPATDLVQRHQEQVGRLDLLEQSLAARPAGDRVAQLASTAGPAPRSPARTPASARPGAPAPPRPDNPERSDGCR